MNTTITSLAWQGQRPQRLSKQGWDITMPWCCQDLKLPRTISWVTATQELPTAPWPSFPVRLQDHPLEPLLFCCASAFSFPGKMVSNLSQQILFFNLIIFMGDVEIHFPVLGCICGDLLVRKLVSVFTLPCINQLFERKQVN